YIGGIVLLGIILVGFVFPDVGWFGATANDGWNIRIAMIVSAAWFGLFAIPTFFAVPEIAPDPEAQTRSVIGAYADLFRQLHRLWKESRNVLLFLIASAVFRDGLAGVFAFAGVIAARSCGFESDTVIIFAIAANVVAGLATISLGFVEHRVGPKNIMVGSIVCMVLAGMLIFMLNPLGAWVFWVFG